PDAMLQYLLYCYNPGQETLIRDVRMLPAGHVLTLDGGVVSLRRDWRLSFAEVREKTEAQYRDEVRALSQDAIRLRMKPECGEGGDELFAGHPVYVADKLATVVDRFPRAVVGTLSRVFQRVPDSDQKKDVRVKLKRFAYGLALPPELLSHRWRIYYATAELRE